MNEILTRIKEFVETTGLSDSAFARRIGLNQSSFSNLFQRDTIPRSDLIAKITNEFNVNSHWVLTGNGDMLLSDTLSCKPVRSYSEGVPYYSIEAMAHISEAGEVFEQTPEYYISYKPFDDCTAWLPVYGDSMVPVIQSGEIIAVKRLMNLDILLWGEPYLIVTNELANNLRTVKLVFQHPDATRIILRASNPEFSGDTIIPKSSITALFLVKGKISRRQL